MNLPANHRRRLSVTAHMVEESLEKLERLLSGHGVHGKTRRVEEAYSEEQRKDLLEVIRKMKAANAQMVVDLHLESSVLLESQIVRGVTAHIWTVLVDSRSEAMSGFGELPVDAARAVDRHVAKLLELLKSLEE